MNMKGVKIVSYMVEFDLVISLDIMDSIDYMMFDFIKLGGGLVISFYD